MSNRTTLYRALGDPAHRFVNFVAFNRPISPLALTVLIQRVQAGDIRVRVNMNMPRGADAYYDPGCNTIFVPFHGYGGQPEHQMILMHESIHAILDMYQGRTSSGQVRPLRVRDDETMAYLGAALYGIGRGLPIGGSSASPARVADGVARAKLGGSTPPSQPLQFTARELAPLQRAVRNDPLYRADAMTMAFHDGVDQRLQCAQP